MSLDVYLKCTVCNHTLFEGNITHNLSRMAKQAGVYDCLWRAHENNFKKAIQLIPLLKTAINDMMKRPEFFKQFNPSNGLGSYDIFLSFLNELLIACKKYQDAIIKMDR